MANGMNIFERASRKKYRFSHKGLCSVEDLWDLEVTELDAIFKKLNGQQKAQAEESLLTKQTTKDADLETQIAILKHIVTTKQTEAEAALNSVRRKQEKQRLLEILSNKQEAELLNKSAEEIQAMIDSLEL